MEISIQINTLSQIQDILEEQKQIWKDRKSSKPSITLGNIIDCILIIRFIKELIQKNKDHLIHVYLKKNDLLKKIKKCFLRNKNIECEDFELKKKIVQENLLKIITIYKK